MRRGFWRALALLLLGACGEAEEDGNVAPGTGGACEAGCARLAACDPGASEQGEATCVTLCAVAPGNACYEAAFDACFRCAEEAPCDEVPARCAAPCDLSQCGIQPDPRAD